MKGCFFILKLLHQMVKTFFFFLHTNLYKGHQKFWRGRYDRVHILLTERRQSSSCPLQMQIFKALNRYAVMLLHYTLAVYSTLFFFFPFQTSYGTINPVWGEAFTFFIHDPRKQDLDIQARLIAN